MTHREQTEERIVEILPRGKRISRKELDLAWVARELADNLDAIEEFMRQCAADGVVPSSAALDALQNHRSNDQPQNQAKRKA